MSYPCIWHDGGRAESKRPKQHYDCTVRALAIVTGESYDWAHDCLAKHGRKSGRKFRLEYLLNSSVKFLKKDLGWQVTKISFPAEKGQPRMNPVTFAQEFSEGRYIVKVAKHVFAFIDGYAYDEFPKQPDERCIYHAWRFTAEHEKENSTISAPESSSVNLQTPGTN